MSRMEPATLPDGRYDAFVIWAERSDDGSLTLELTVVSGDHKGDVVSIVGDPRAADPIALTGLPCTLIVADGMPRIEE